MIGALLLLAAGLGSVPQGKMLELEGPEKAVSARLDERTIPLFSAEGSGKSEGIIGIPVLAKPGPHTLEYLDKDGKVIESESLTVRDAHFPKQFVTLPKQVAELHSTPSERDDVGTFMTQVSPKRMWQLPLVPPLQSCTTSPFGVARYINGKPTGDFHAGLDQRGAAGTPIHAVAAGTVRLAGEYALHGGTVGIDHGQGLKSMYLHMSKVAAQDGEAVKAGDVIGYVGSTGRSTAPHLHWSLYANGDPVNPLQFVHLSPCPPRTSAGKRK